MSAGCGPQHACTSSLRASHCVGGGAAHGEEGLRREDAHQSDRHHRIGWALVADDLPGDRERLDQVGGHGAREDRHVGEEDGGRAAEDGVLA